MQLKRSEKLELILESLPKTIEACKAWEKNRNIGIQAAVIYTTDWQDCPCPSFDPEKHRYRICEKTPLTQEQAEALVETVLINSSTLPSKSRYIVVQTTDSGIWIKGLQLYSSTLHISYETLTNGFWESKEGIKLWR